MPSKELIPFGEDYAVPSGSDEDIPSAASSEQLDEENFKWLSNLLSAHLNSLYHRWPPKSSPPIPLRTVLLLEDLSHI